MVGQSYHRSGKQEGDEGGPWFSDGFRVPSEVLGRIARVTKEQHW